MKGKKYSPLLTLHCMTLKDGFMRKRPRLPQRFFFYNLSERFYLVEKNGFFLSLVVSREKILCPHITCAIRSWIAFNLCLNHSRMLLFPPCTNKIMFWHQYSAIYHCMFRLTTTAANGLFNTDWIFITSIIFSQSWFCCLDQSIFWVIF